MSAVAVKNYKVVRGRHGDFPAGSVLAKWMVERSGHDASWYVARGAMVETDDDVNVVYEVPQEDEPEPDGVAEMAADLARLRARLDQTEAAKKSLTGQVAELTALNETQKNALTEQTVQITKWRGLAEEREAKCIELEKQIRENIQKAEAPKAPVAPDLKKGK